MKHLKITTYWTPEEADCIYQLLGEFREVIWQHYGDEIVKMHHAIHDEQQSSDAERGFDDEIAF